MRKVSRMGAVLLLAAASTLHAESLTIDCGDVAVDRASAMGIGSGKTVPGAVADRQVRFDNLLPGERYDVTLIPPQGPHLRLLDCSWHSDAPPPVAEPGPLSEEDRAEIHTILREIKTFTNRNAILQLLGNADRAVAIVELTRDSDFHARKGDEIIWRIEVWYFENQAGGWAKVQQQNRVVERVRFKTQADYDARRAGVRWIGIESGLRIGRGEPSRVTLPPAQP